MATAGVLRGASVATDARRVGRVLTAVLLASLAVSALALFWAGARHNDRILRLRQDGVPVTATVTGCLGLMGGSGSNLVGYACRGTFSLAGHTYSEALPGDSLRPPGTRIALVSVPGSPGLLATPAEAAAGRTSSTVFVAPVALAGALGLAGASLVLRRRWRPGGRSARPPALV